MNSVQILAVLLLLTVGSASATYISGPISGILPVDNYVVTSDLSIVEGDTLVIQPGTTFHFQTNCNFIIGENRRLICQGSEGSIVEFSGGQYWGHLVFENSGNDDLIEHANILHGYGENGGAIYCLNTSLQIDNCRLVDNLSLEGGAMMLENCPNPVITNSLFQRNEIGYAGLGGGAISCLNSDPVISGCEFYDNDAFDDDYNSIVGGALFLRNSDAVIYDCEFLRNATEHAGGAINGSAVIISHCYFEGNYASSGAAISGSGSVVSYCTFTLNEAYWGDIISGGAQTVENCTITNNGVVNIGAAVSIGGSSIMVNCIVSGNYCRGIRISSEDVQVHHCDVYDNSPNYYGNGVDSDLGVNAIVNANGDSCDVFYNISLDPQFVDPGGDDFNLTPESPCIDAGDPAGELDPDDTIADIGALYFDQSNVGVYDIRDANLPAQWSMSPVYPNPFNSMTQFSVELPAPGELMVAVYNVMGQQVAVLANREYPSGRHSFTFDASGLASGLYFLRTEVPGQFSQTQKMMLVR